MRTKLLLILLSISFSVFSFSKVNSESTFNISDRIIVENVSSKFSFKEHFSVVISKNTIKVYSKNNEKINRIELLDLNGNIIKSSNENTINQSGLPSGVYILKVITNKGIFAKKIVK